MEGMNSNIMFKIITYNQLKNIRKKQWLKQGKKCAILKKGIPYKDATMDHKHCKGKKIGKEGAGCLRGVLDFRANSFEGKIANLYVRLGLSKLIDLPSLLRNTAEYIENPPMKPLYIHPSEREKPKKLGKREYNKLKKYYLQIYPKRKKIPEYPKSGKMTKEFEKMLKDMNEYLRKTNE